MKLLMAHIAVSIIPTGTGNDFVRAISIGKTLTQQIETAISGKIKTIDLGKCNDRLFINCMGFGFDGQVVEEMEQKGKIFGGHMAYLYTILKTITTYQQPTVHFKVDGVDYQESVFLTAINNGHAYGGGLPITPHAKLDDGLLDICFMKGMPVYRRLINLPLLQLGKHEQAREVTLWQGKQITVAANPNVVAHVDGELIGPPPYHITILPQHLKVRVQD